MNFDEWARQVPERIRQDPVWRFMAYRRALFLHDLAWEDIRAWPRSPGVFALADQLVRSVGSISANIEEGYGRGYGADRNRFLRIAIGSAREAKGWYYRAHHLLPTPVLEDRLALLDSIIGLLITELNYQKKHHPR